MTGVSTPPIRARHPVKSTLERLHWFLAKTRSDPGAMTKTGGASGLKHSDGQAGYGEIEGATGSQTHGIGASKRALEPVSILMRIKRSSAVTATTPALVIVNSDADSVLRGRTLRVALS